MQKSFTILALAAAASACDLSVPQQDLADYRDQALQNFTYLDQCSQDKNGKIDLDEFKALALNLLGEQKTEAELAAMFKQYDLNEDGLVDLNDMVNATRAITSPAIDVHGDGQYLPWEQDLFTYMSIWVDTSAANTVSPPDYTLMVEKENNYVTRKQLKAVLPMLYPERVQKDGIDIVLEEETMRWSYKYCPAQVNPICEDVQKYAYPGVSMQQFRMSNTDFNRHKGHQHHMTMFWNQAKKRGENNYAKVSGKETLTWDEWNYQQNPWVRRDFAPDATIPEERLRGYFNYLDENKDGVMSFSEMWKMMQKSDVQFNQQRDYHQHFDLDKDYKVTIKELEKVYTDAGVTDPATDAEIFIMKYGTGEGVSDFWGYWGRVHHIRDQEINKYLQLIRDTGIIPGKHLAVDINKDGVISQQEVIDMYGQEVYDQLGQYYNGDLSKMTAPEDFINFIHERQAALEKLQSWYYPYDSNCDGKIQRMDLGYKYSKEIGIYDVAKLDAIYDAMDEDGDGVVEFGELCRTTLLPGKNSVYCPDDAPKTDYPCQPWTILDHLKESFSPDNTNYDGNPVTVEDYAKVYAHWGDHSPHKVLFDLHDVDGDDFVVYDDILRLSDHIMFPSPDVDSDFMEYVLIDGTVLDEAEFTNIYFELLAENYVHPIDQEVLGNMYQALSTHFGSNGVIDHPLVVEMIKYGFVYGWNQVIMQVGFGEYIEKHKNEEDADKTN